MPKDNEEDESPKAPWPRHGWVSDLSMDGDGSVTCDSEGPKDEERERAGEPHCYSPLH